MIKREICDFVTLILNMENLITFLIRSVSERNFYYLKKIKTDLLKSKFRFGNDKDKNMRTVRKMVLTICSNTNI